MCEQNIEEKSGIVVRTKKQLLFIGGKIGAFSEYVDLLQREKDWIRGTRGSLFYEL